MLAQQPSRPHLLRRSAVGLVLAVLWALRPGIASAHAHLVQANPAPGSVAARAPAVASFLFDEPLNPTLTHVRLADAAGHSVSMSGGYLASGHNAELWRLPLPRLAAGTYSVYWTSESATDGHVMSSFYTFRVAASGGANALRAVSGAAGGAMDGATNGTGTLVAISADAATLALFIWFGQMAQALWLGALIVELAILAPARRLATAQGDLARAATRRVWALGCGAMLATMASLLAQLVCLAVQGTGGDWARALARGTLGGMLSSQNGQLMVARLALLVGAILLGRQVSLPAFRPSRRGRPLPRPAGALGIVAPAFTRPRWETSPAMMFVLAGLYMLLVALSGHAANVSPVWLSCGIDWVHLVGTAAWVGGMGALAYGVLPFRHTLAQDQRAPAVLALLDRFSPVAYIAVGSLALSGLFAALSHLHSPDAVVGTTYGHLLTLKSALVGTLIVLSASHVRHLRPLIARAQRQLSAHLPLFHDGPDTDHVQTGLSDGLEGANAPVEARDALGDAGIQAGIQRAVGARLHIAATVHEGLATLAGRLRVETAIGAAVLLITALMSQTLPATSLPAAGTAPVPHAAIAAMMPAPAAIADTARLGDLRVALTVAPPAVGMTTFALHVWEQGQPITDNTGAILVHLSPLAQPNLRANLTTTGQGARFVAQGGLAMTGTWRADVLVRTMTVNDYRTVPFIFTVGARPRFLTGVESGRPLMHGGRLHPAVAMPGM